MSVPNGTILTQPNERKHMSSSPLEVGQTYTTTSSNVTGVIKAIEPHPSGVSRVLLDVAGKDRWTSVSN
jgi:hypothetical protein